MGTCFCVGGNPCPCKRRTMLGESNLIREAFLMQGETIIGTCGNCGGPVIRETVGMPPSPRPYCKSCKAVPQEAYGPTIPMGSPPQQWDHSGTGDLRETRR